MWRCAAALLGRAPAIAITFREIEGRCAGGPRQLQFFYLLSCLWLYTQFKIRPAVWCGRCGRISVYVCQDGVKVELVHSERQTPDLARRHARGGNGISGDSADYLRPHLRHAPWPCALWPQTLGLRNRRIVLVYTVHGSVRRVLAAPRFQCATEPQRHPQFVYVFLMCSRLLFFRQAVAVDVTDAFGRFAQRSQRR